MRSDDEGTIRPLREEDTDAIVALYDRAASVDRGLGPVPRATWQHFIKLPQNQGCRDFRVAERQGTLIRVITEGPEGAQGSELQAGR